MTKNLLFGKNTFTKIVCFLSIFAVQIYLAQITPANTRLMQLNTSKGSTLSLVELSESFAYHIGTSNSSEIGLDGLSATSVGLDDMYVLKSTASTGANVWVKTFNAGNQGIITPRYVSVDASENLYVFGSFKGSITVGSKTITSVNTNDTFIMKISNNGSAVWVNYIANGYNSLFNKVKYVADSTDGFFVYNQRHLVRFNNRTGEIIYDKIYPEMDIKTVALQNNNLYIGGNTLSANNIGSEVLPDSKAGFVLKGDKDANFVASARISGQGYQGGIGDVNDISFSSDGKLVLAGFSLSSVNLISETGTTPYNYNPVNTYESPRYYYYTAKISADLGNVSFFRSSGAFNTDASYFDTLSRGDILNIKIIPYGTSGNFKMKLRSNFYDNRNQINSFTNSNGTTTTVSSGGINGTQARYEILLSQDATGNYLSASQPILGGTGIQPLMSDSGNNYSQSAINGRLFNTNIYSVSGSLLWSKQKTTSIGGGLGNQFVRHLSSAKGDMFFTSLVSGKANFFGKQINNIQGVSSRYITRLGIDGLPKWFARFNPDSGARELNASSDFSCVDKDDNFIVLANTSGATSTFIDATGNFADFNQNILVSSKVLVKLDKNGKLLWSKQLVPSTAGTVNAAVTTDSAGNVYIMGTTTKNLNIDGNVIPTSGSNNIFLIKFSFDGILQYAKSYQNVGAYSLLPVFDAQDNLYIFTEPYGNGTNYIFDGITVPATADLVDHLMLKFNSSGSVISGKNFYADLPAGSTGYSWPNDVVFDGDHFIIMGNYYSWDNNDTKFNGLDMALIPKIYSPETFITFLAKVKTDGTVVWQKPINSNSNTGTGSYTNIDIDANKNIYMHWFVKDKISLNGTEYAFNAETGNKILTKLDTDGNLKFNKVVDANQSSYPMIDVFGNDKLNISGFTSSNNILNYPIPYSRASSLYIATFGNLDSYYLTPTKDYLQLNDIVMENNADNANTFSFDLINNVDWNATSDESWLNLSFLSLTGKYDFKNLISGNGDAKIIMAANTNNTNATRSANVMVSGTGVNSKTIIVTQNFVLATGEQKTFITTLYPNPTSDILNIDTKQTISKIEIFDLSGKLVKSESGKGKKITVSQLTKGMYLIKLHTENGVVNSKFIKN